jgi:4-diphosphocytidyl-2-C-methyl-D-erythritol kinase
MVVFSNCKINLGLNILRKRADGYHDLETVFYPLHLYDIIEIVEAKSAKGLIEFSDSGLSFKVDDEHNLCFKAYHLLKKGFPNLPAVKIHLHKSIPMGAGLGGGSANATFTLKLLNEKFGLNVPTKTLLNYALQLGSDCPFFVLNKPCLAESRGEILNEITLDLSGYKFLIINPGIHVNTRNAFSKISPKNPTNNLRDIVKLPVAEWKNFLVNDFEKVVSEEHVALQNIKQILYENGAEYAAMSGSGSTMFGIFKASENLNDFHFPGNYFVKEIAI